MGVYDEAMTSGFMGPTRPRDGSPADYAGPTVNPYQAPQSNILQSWNSKYGPNSPVNYMDENWRNAAEGYANYFAIPYANAELAQRTQGFNEWNAQATLAEQQRLNQHQMGLDTRGADREDLALSYNQQNNTRDFGESQRQFNQNYGLQQELGRGQLAATNYANQTARNDAVERARIADYEARTGRIDVEGRQRLEQYANETDRTRVGNDYILGQGALANQGYANQTERDRANNDYSLGREGLANDRTRMGNDYILGQGALANQGYANQAQAQRFQGQTANEAMANQTANTKVQNDYSLGQGSLTFQNRELDTNAQLQRERMANDMKLQTIQSTGRNVMPNQRAVRQWY